MGSEKPVLVLVMSQLRVLYYNYEIPQKYNVPAGAVGSGFDGMVEVVGWIRVDMESMIVSVVT